MAQGKLRLTINKKPDPIWTQESEIISIRKENNAHDTNFSYANLIPDSFPAMHIFYQEGIPGDTANTYIAIGTQFAQSVSAGPGTMELHIVSNGVGNQLDKTVSFNIGSNPVSAYINFESRPDTTDIVKSVPSYMTPISITAADVLAHCSDFDGSAIVQMCIHTGGDPNFEWNGQLYTDGQLIDIVDLDTNPIIYTPVANPLGYYIEFPWSVVDEDGLITNIN